MQPAEPEDGLLEECDLLRRAVCHQFGFDNMVGRSAVMRRVCKLGLSDIAQRRLANHDWPGNVRELEKRLERAAMLCVSGRIDVDLIGFSSARERPAARSQRGQSASVTSRSSGTRPGTGSGIDIDGPDLSEKDRVIAALERAGRVQAGQGGAHPGHDAAPDRLAYPDPGDRRETVPSTAAEPLVAERVPACGKASASGGGRGGHLAGRRGC